MFVFRLIIRAEDKSYFHYRSLPFDVGLLNRVGWSSHDRVFHSRRRWSEAVPNARDRVCPLESIARDGQAARKPARPRTAHRSTPSAPPRPPVPLARVSRPTLRGGRSPRKPGTGKTSRGTSRRAANFVRTLSRCSSNAICITKSGKLFHNENIAAGIFMRYFSYNVQNHVIFLSLEKTRASMKSNNKTGFTVMLNYYEDCVKYNLFFCFV